MQGAREVHITAGARKRSATYASWKAPPVMTFLQPLHSQMPTHARFTESRPQKTQWYCERKRANVKAMCGKRVNEGSPILTFACCVISIFLTNLRSVAP